MARPLRIEWPGGRYHVTARGNEQRNIFRDDQDRQHFLKLMEELPDRFGVLLHAYVLKDNHYHVLLETHDGGTLSDKSQVTESKTETNRHGDPLITRGKRRGQNHKKRRA